jgi:MmyB-like transcription regulator ligand binding domain
VLELRIPLIGGGVRTFRATLRTEAGRDPYDKGLTDLVGELCTRSDAFPVRWAAHDVHLHWTGMKHFQHPVVGELHLSYEVMELPADPGQALVAFSAAAGTPDDDALRFLASWAAGHDPADALATPNDV